MSPRIVLRAPSIIAALASAACVVTSTDREQRSIVVEEGAPCPGRDHPALHEPRFRTEGDDAEVASVDAGPVEGPFTDSVRPDGIVRLRACSSQVTLESGGGLAD